jgi:hypothetical protein
MTGTHYKAAKRVLALCFILILEAALARGLYILFFR